MSTPALHPPADAFVGRAAEFAQLRTALREAEQGHGRLWLLAGPAGIGKTRLTEELGTYARDGGARVVWGRCWEEGGAPAYWPWVQILRGLAHLGDLAAAAEASGAPAQLAQLLPELSSTRAGQEPTDDSADAPDLRFQLFDWITRFIAKVASEQTAQGHPLVLVLDDVHAADDPSLLLLKFIARDVWNVPILLIASYRDEQTNLSAGTRDLLAGVAKNGRYLRLAGLSKPDVREFIGTAGVDAPPAAMVTALHEATDGNPYFLQQVVRQLERTKQAPNGLPLDVPVPGEIRDLLRDRLRPLPDDVTRVLGYASVIGRDFELTSLRYLAHRPEDELAELLQAPLDAGILVAERDGTYRFTHGLLRQTMYTDLPSDLRGGLHRRIGEVLEGHYAADLEPHTAELAHHFVDAISHGQPIEPYAAKALEYSMRAGRRAATVLAYEEAIAHYERAMKILDRTTHDTATRCDLLLALGTSQRRAGRVSRARQTFRRAATLARTLGSPDRLGRAALGFGGQRLEYGDVDEELIGLLDEAIVATPSTDLATRSRLLARLAIALYFTPDLARRSKLADEAVALARSIDDSAALGIALAARHFAIWGPDSLEQRLADADELIAIAHHAGDRTLLLEGRVWRIVDLLELGEFATAFAEIDAFTTLADELRLPLFRWYAEEFAVSRALMAGPLDNEAERRASAAAQLGTRSGVRSAGQFFGAQLFLQRREQGRLGELEDAVVGLVDEFPALWAWPAALLLLHAELGREDQARRDLAALSANGFADVPRDGNWLLVMALLAEACAILEDVPRARMLYDALRPFAARTVVVASAVACLGPVSDYLGLLAATLGDRDAAVMHLHDALDAAARAGARSWDQKARRALADLEQS